ncbi:hypothetical protein LTR46_007067 [Exophiala xenobiotica]|nr:hypothetical protein LTR18_009091 [Exophiala xenobiotica]KAK5554863.1 hypothetical protein LTR46_007067 [Exophiala xenobiotica]
MSTTPQRMGCSAGYDSIRKCSMASPSYGERPPLQGYRRSFTLPARQLTVHERAGLERSDADANVLWSHPSARIIAFSPPTDSISSQSKEPLPDTDYPVDAIETLPWRSRTETLAATGQIMIEKVRGSSNFLKSADQKVIHTIMRNSQCWCVDGESKFVLRTGKLRYYRIELPSETDADKEKVEELKTVLSKVLRFERTPCPFKRAFHVDLPDDAITPRRKGVWTRKQPSQPTSPSTDPLPLRRTKTSRAWSLQGPATSTPLEHYGRRGSDYGYGQSRESSPIPPHESDRWRPSTPSSLASSEIVGEREPEEQPYQEDESYDDSHLPMLDDHGSPADAEVEETAHISELPSSDPPRESPFPEGAMELENQESVDLGRTVEVQLAAASNDEAESDGSKAPSELREADPVIPPQSLEGNSKPPSRGFDKAMDSTEAPAELPSDVDASESTQIAGTEVNQVEPSDEAPTTGDGLPARSSETEASSTAELGEAAAERVSMTVTNYLGSNPSPDDFVEEDGLANSTPSNSENIADDAPDEVEDGDALSRISSIDSFHTTNSLAEENAVEHENTLDSERTPQDERFDPFLNQKPQHRRGVSEMTITASTADMRPSTGDSSEKPATPALGRSPTSDLSWPEVYTPESPITEGLRRRLDKKRSLSPLPPSTTIFSPGSPSQGNHFTAEMLQKACNIALVKPIEAVVLLVHILARIASGATVNDLLSGELFRRPEQRRRRSSFPDQASSPHDDSDDEDDFGVPIRRGRTRNDVAKSPSSTKKNSDADSIFDLD